MHISSSASLAALAVALSLASISPAIAQEPAPEAQEQDGGEVITPEPTTDEDTIVVFGTRLIGRVETPVPPVLELGEEDIAAYGAGSIAELLDLLAPQVSSARGRGDGGRPVVLVNGMRVSSFRELRSYPPEAIERIEVFPEEVAQSYGYSPDQRVVNFILKDNFSSREIEVEYGQPWDGGYSTQEVEATYLRLDGPSRLNFNLDWNNSSVLTEAERGIVQSGPPDLPGDPDPGRYRSLVADTASLEATGNWTTRLGAAGNSLSVNATFEREDSLSLQGLDTVLLADAPEGDPARVQALRKVNAADPLTVDNRSETYALGGTLSLGLGEWDVTGTFDGTYTNSRSLIARQLDLTDLQDAALAGTLALDAELGPFADAGEDEALSKTYTVDSLATARTNPLTLPAGDVSLTLDTGFRWNRIESEDTRNPGLPVTLSRERLSAGVNLGVPLTSRREDFLGGIGDFSLSAALGVDELSDFGTLLDTTLGLTWGLTDTLTLTATYINRDTAPTLTQLGAPEIATPNVQVYDISRDETVLATVITGGNPFIPAQNQSDWKISANWELPFLERSNISIDYIRNHSDDVAASFPVLTPAIEAAFPGRVTRDAAGRLIQLDQRPVSFAEQDIERLQFGINLSGELGSSDEAEGRGGRFGGGREGPGGGARRAAAAGGVPAEAGGEPQGGRDPARFQALRQLLCGEDGSENALRLARGETITTAEGQPISLPPRMLERMQAGGEPDPAQVERVREGVCSDDGPPRGAGAPGEGGEQAGGRAPGAQAGGPSAARRGPGFGPPAGGRWFFNLQYIYEIGNEVLVAPGGPLLDLLDGDALSGGGQARHSANARLGAFVDGFGAFLVGEYTGSSRIDGSGQPGSADLSFGDFATFDVRLFVDMNQQESLVEKVPLLDNVRVSLGVDNIFDARQRVTDAEGDVPLRYQPFLIDPIGRSFEIEFRKLF